MPYLGDYLGHLLSEITNARVQADLESVRIAELYASHPLLRHMAVPRFRLPNVTVDVPVIVRKMDEAVPGQPLRGGISLEDVHQAIERGLSAALDRNTLKIAPKRKLELREAMTHSAARFRPAAGAAIPAGDIDGIATAAGEAFVELLCAQVEISSDAASRLQKVIYETIAATLRQAGQAVPRLHVAVTASELREAGPPELMARLHLAVSEEAMEWSVSESNGTTTSRLVAE
jgi:hypothetical protein